MAHGRVRAWIAAIGATAGIVAVGAPAASAAPAAETAYLRAGYYLPVTAQKINTLHLRVTVPQVQCPPVSQLRAGLSMSFGLRESDGTTDGGAFHLAFATVGADCPRTGGTSGTSAVAPAPTYGAGFVLDGNGGSRSFTPRPGDVIVIDQSVTATHHWISVQDITSGKKVSGSAATGFVPDQAELKTEIGAIAGLPVVLRGFSTVAIDDLTIGQPIVASAVTRYDATDEQGRVRIVTSALKNATHSFTETWRPAS